MLKRTIEVSTPGTQLFLRMRQLVIAREGQELGQAPIEDLGVVVLEGRQITVSTGALDALVGAGVALAICDERHNPSGLLLPVTANSLQTERFRHQLAAPLPLYKQLWCRIVRAKIAGQATLFPSEHPARIRLEALAGRVRSGDPANVEAQAARVYWSALFGEESGFALPEPFRRSRDGGPPNNLLNYAYMALRAAVARAVVGAGLHAALGIAHHNRGNAFCLADDLMEPFRPLADARVRVLVKSGELELTPQTKRVLLTVLTDPITVAGVEGPFSVAVQRTVASLCRCFALNYSQRRNSNGNGRHTASRLADELDLPVYPPLLSVPLGKTDTDDETDGGD